MFKRSLTRFFITPFLTKTWKRTLLTANDKQTKLIKSLEKDIFYSNQTLENEEWLFNIRLYGNYQKTNHMLQNSTEKEINRKIKTDFILFGDNEGWNKLKQKCSRVIPGIEPSSDKPHLLVGYFKDKAYSLNEATNECNEIINVSSVHSTDCLDIVTAVFVNSGFVQFDTWVESSFGKEWFMKYPSINLIHFPYNSVLYLMEKQIEFETKTMEYQKRNKELLTELCERVFNETPDQNATTEELYFKVFKHFIRQSILQEKLNEEN